MCITTLICTNTERKTGHNRLTETIISMSITCLRGSIGSKDERALSGPLEILPSSS